LPMALVHITQLVGRIFASGTRAYHPIGQPHICH
jgi:hypothetical protein